MVYTHPHDEKEQQVLDVVTPVVDPSTPVHFFSGPGPLDVTKTRRGWRFYWYLDKVEGVDRRKARRAIRKVLRHPRGWKRTGVKWVRTMDPTKANILVSVIPQDTSPCGKGSAGCYSWGNGTPRADLGVEHIDHADMFAELVNMEICGHGTFRMTDMYQGEGHNPDTYRGVMGTWAGSKLTGYMPSDQEIQSAIDWLHGVIDPSRIHWD